MRLMNFYKIFTTKDAIASISDSIRLVSKPLFIYSLFKFSMPKYAFCLVLSNPYLKEWAFCTVFVRLHLFLKKVISCIR